MGRRVLAVEGVAVLDVVAVIGKDVVVVVLMLVLAMGAVVVCEVGFVMNDHSMT